MKPDLIESLQDAIKAMHDCDSKHVKTVRVPEMFEKQAPWEGFVEVFDLLEHQKAKRCYAWQYKDGNETKSVAVLEIPPVDSPESAVKVAIASRGRKF